MCLPVENYHWRHLHDEIHPLCWRASTRIRTKLLKHAHLATWRPGDAQQTARGYVHEIKYMRHHDRQNSQKEKSKKKAKKQKNWDRE
jgi:hypothetical protein